MGHTVIDARDMDLPEYQNLIMGWNETERDPDAHDPPTPEWWEKQQERIMKSPHLTGRPAA